MVKDFDVNGCGITKHFRETVSVKSQKRVFCISDVLKNFVVTEKSVDSLFDLKAIDIRYVGMRKNTFHCDLPFACVFQMSSLFENSFFRRLSLKAHPSKY